ncbi:MAG: beta-propeller fold lactonase family protein [Verrucomicrobia bacterium]|nr:beta-propeller fold lactonase family protein [Verrucomicrobiota bacterium]
MKKILPQPLATLLLTAITLCLVAPANALWFRTPAKGASDYLSPEALVASPDGKTLYVACETGNLVMALDTASGKATRLSVPASPSGLALSADGARLYVTCAAPVSTICVVEAASGKILDKIPAGHTTVAPVLSPDGKTLYVCDRFNNAVGVVDLASGKETARIPVAREPVSAAITPDGKFLLVANHLHNGRADVDVVAAKVSIIDTAAGKVVKEIQLPNGSGLLRDIRISPDGKIAAVAHQLARFHLPTTQLERGWMNTNALSLIDLAGQKLINTVLLDNVDSGAANPWGVAWSADGKLICVTHAGTHELSVIDAPALMAKLAKMPEALDPNAKIDYNAASRVAADVPNDLSFLVGVRQRIKLPGNGPRGLALAGTKAYAAMHFTDSLAVVDVAAERPAPVSIALGQGKKLGVVRKGDMLWNDATICFQGWQSCSSCHSSDARVDALNWDLLNDGIGNPKNSKTLLLAFQTPPAMSLGVRATAKTAVRAGIKHILFAVRPEEDALALDAFIEALQQIPSPCLEKGRLSAAAERGKKLYSSKEVGCADCHKGRLLTDLKPYDVGSRGQFDKPGDTFYTPTLVEVWRTAPFMHDGSAATMMDVLTTRNPDDKHGKTKHLNKQQLEDLAVYVLSL